MKRMLQKTSQLTVFMLLFTAMFPILALAATGFQSYEYKNGTVSGVVYSDQNPSITEAVYIYNPNGGFVGAANVSGVTYSVYNDVYTYRYSFSSFVGNLYPYLNLKEKVTDSVYQTVYNTTSNNNNNNNNNNGGGSSGGGGGGGGGGGASSGATISVNSDGSIDANTLTNALNAYDSVELNLNGDLVLVPANALVNFISTKKVLVVKNANGTYIVPVSVLKVNDLAKQLGIEVSDLSIKISIAAVTGTTATDIASAAQALGGSAAGKAVDFNVVAVGKDNKTAAVDFGDTYVKRIVTIDKALDFNKATGVLYNPDTKKLTFVPSVLSAKDGKTEVTLQRNGSSIYTVIELSKSFEDIKGHWAQSYVELLAGKLVVDGVTDTSFQPDRNISRAEFAALVVRSLGLDAGTYAGTFGDVSANAWYAGVVGAAVKAHIIDGYEDGTFRPDKQISREELAAMVVRALKYAGINTELSAEQQTSMLAKFSDASSIVWAQKEIATAIYNGIIEGMTDTTIGASQNATRAQSATMLKRLLSGAAFIN